MRNQSVRWMPRLVVASGPSGNADTTYSQHTVVHEMSRTSRVTSPKS